MSVSIHKVPGSAPAQKDVPPWYKRFDVNGWQDWAGVLMPHKHNWSDFTLINISGEYGGYKNSVEFEAALLGFHVMVTWWWDGPELQGFRDVIEQIENGTIETVPFNFERDGDAGIRTPEGSEG